MFALRPAQDAVNGSGQGGSRVVLPRWLRRPARALSRRVEGGGDVPPFAATLLSALLLGATGIYGVAVGGHYPAIVQAVTARTGFAVADIRVIGNRETSEIDVVGSLGLNGYTSLVGFDVHDARDRVASLPWVESATIRKVYPATVEIELVERKPFAIWQNGGDLVLIEADGRSIVPYTGAVHSDLPFVVGAGAAGLAQAFMQEVARYPDIARKAVAYVRVGDRRWDVRLRDGVTIRLPEREPGKALAMFARIDAEQDLLARDIVAVDMRQADRVAVQLSPDAAKVREEAMKKVLAAMRGRRT